MNKGLLFAFALLGLGCVLASPTMLYVVAEPLAAGECVLVDHREAVPEWVSLPDPDKLPGYVLPPFPEDPNRWELPRGLFVRTGRACDPDGDDFVVEYVGGTTPATVTLDLEAGTWTMEVDAVHGGFNSWVFTARDVHGASRTFIVVGEAANAAPILE